MRIDKWLWAARFFKTRSIAAHACELGRIQINGQATKASKDIKVGDKLKVKNEAGEFQVEVLGLSEMRGPAAAAQKLYHEDDASREFRLQLAADRKAMFEADGFSDSKPSKRDRRVINRLRGRS